MIIKKAEILDERGRRLIGKYLLGGAAAGTSAALATSLVNYYRTLQREADAASDTSKDDDILYLNLRQNPTNAPKKVKGTQASQEAKTASISGGLAITGGALAGLGSYAAVRKLYQDYKKKRLQEQLDAAQQGFFDVVSQEASAEKRAFMGLPPGVGAAIASAGAHAQQAEPKPKNRVYDKANWHVDDGTIPPHILELLRILQEKKMLNEYGSSIAAVPDGEISLTSEMLTPEGQQFLESDENAGLLNNAKRAAEDGKPMGGVEFATSMPVTLTLLAALASGALTHRALEKTFPRAKKPQSPEPKKIVIRNQEDPSFYETVQEEDDNGDPIPKEASYHSRNDYDTYCDGLELLVHMCLGREKVANVSDLHNMVGAIAEGRKQEVIDNVMSLGFDAAMDLCKGAYENIKKASPQDIAIAVGTCVHTPELQSITSVLAASEYDDMAPHFSKVAASQPENIQKVLCKIAGNLGAYGRSCIFENAEITMKEAAAPPMDVEQLLELIQMLQQGEGQEPRDRAEGKYVDADENPEDQQTLLSTDSESSEEAMMQNNNESGAGNTEISNKPNIVNKKKVTVEASPKDEIDQMLAGSDGMS